MWTGWHLFERMVRMFLPLSPIVVVLYAYVFIVFQVQFE
jgi:hypothetical protein